jgi:hypothetical protein
MILHFFFLILHFNILELGGCSRLLCQVLRGRNRTEQHDRSGAVAAILLLRVTATASAPPE